MSTRYLTVALLLATMGINAQKPIKAPAGGKAISEELIGIFFEDISSSADGGLYAELIQNGGFEFNANERDGWGPATAWKVIRPGHSLGYIQPTTMGMPGADHTNFHQSNTRMRLHAERTREFYDYKGWRGFGLQNDGFGGIVVKAGEKYDFSARMVNPGDKPMTVRIALVEPQGRDKEPKLLADTILTVVKDAVTTEGRQPRRYFRLHEHTATLTPNADSKKATLQLLMLDEGDVILDDVSLMPQDTYKGHGLRRDLAEALEALHPKFMRFPGGCVVHGGGDGFWDTYRWKNTIGPRHERQQLKNTWGYHQSMGLGYYEYFQFCEDLGMQPLPILPCGVSCQGANGGWSMWPRQAQDACPMEQMDLWVQDALDLIEWANGDPATSEWAKKRADQGHPKPFGLKYLGLGNEEKISPEFAERFRYIYNKVREAHPEIVIVGTAGPGSHPGNPDYDNGWKLADELQMPIIDEHYYEKNDYFLNSRQYDSYPRNRKTKVYLGEYAAKDKKLIDALAEGLYLLHVERNGDVVCMTSYAPLFAKKGATNWNPDLIYFDNERPYLTCSYYVQQMFGQSAGQYYYGDCVSFQCDEAGIVQPVENSLYGQSVILNVKTRKLYVKMVNAGGDVKTANVNLSRFGLKKLATKTVLSGLPTQENNFDQQPIAPQREDIKAQKKFTFQLEPYSIVMLEYSLN